MTPIEGIMLGHPALLAPIGYGNSCDNDPYWASFDNARHPVEQEHPVRVAYDFPDAPTAAQRALIGRSHAHSHRPTTAAV